MSTTITTTPTIGERAIITEYGYRTPATWVEGCDGPMHRGLHWCYDERTPRGATWTTEPNVAREPIPAEPEPREWQAGDVVDHPECGRGLAYDSVIGEPRVLWASGGTLLIDSVADDLTLVLAAPEPKSARERLIEAQRREFGESWDDLVPSVGQTLGWVIESVIEDAVESIVAAREQALREEIAGEIDTANASFGVSEDPYDREYDLGARQGMAEAARIARGGAR